MFIVYSLIATVCLAKLLATISAIVVSPFVSITPTRKDHMAGSYCQGGNENKERA